MTIQVEARLSPLLVVLFILFCGYAAAQDLRLRNMTSTDGNSIGVALYTGCPLWNDSCGLAIGFHEPDTSIRFRLGYGEARLGMSAFGAGGMGLTLNGNGGLGALDHCPQNDSFKCVVITPGSDPQAQGIHVSHIRGVDTNGLRMDFGSSGHLEIGYCDSISPDKKVMFALGEPADREGVLSIMRVDTPGTNGVVYKFGQDGMMEAYSTYMDSFINCLSLKPGIEEEKPAMVLTYTGFDTNGLRMSFGDMAHFDVGYCDSISPKNKLTMALGEDGDLDDVFMIMPVDEPGSQGIVYDFGHFGKMEAYGTYRDSFINCLSLKPGIEEEKPAMVLTYTGFDTNGLRMSFGDMAHFDVGYCDSISPKNKLTMALGEDGDLDDVFMIMPVDEPGNQGIVYDFGHLGKMEAYSTYRDSFINCLSLKPGIEEEKPAMILTHTGMDTNGLRLSFGNIGHFDIGICDSISPRNKLTIALGDPGALARDVFIISNIGDASAEGVKYDLAHIASIEAINDSTKSKIVFKPDSSSTTNAMSLLDLTEAGGPEGIELTFYDTGNETQRITYKYNLSAKQVSTSEVDHVFNGDVHVAGNLSKSAGSFRIDHPLDPDNKYLYHSFVESPDMMNIYNGNIVTDSQGNASVTLPEYFDALNIDFRYQLTVIGQFAQAIVSKKIKGNSFEIMTDKPNVEVSWQVTGVRNDKYARENRIQVEVSKEKLEFAGQGK